MIATVRRDWELELDVDDVLRGQAADPEVVRSRRPRLVEIARRALDEGLDLVEPAVLARELAVTGTHHNHVRFGDGKRLTGRLVAEHLGCADRVVVMLCTIGSRLEDRVATVAETDLVLGLALDAVGSAAVHALSVSACREIEDDAAESGQQTTAPLSPGLDGWPVDVGQREIFSLVDAAAAGIELTPTFEMRPLKSLTVVLGVGEGLASGGVVCDYCGLRHTCRMKVD